MPWYSVPPVRFALYGLAGLLAAVELVVFGLALSPDVDPIYRAYYIDKTTTCLDRRAAGDYAPATTVSFRPDGAAEAKAMRVCGWDGPAGDGTHSVGTTSRLRVRTPPAEGGLVLKLEMTAVLPPEQPQQRVRVSINGLPAGQATLVGSAPQMASFPVPAAASRDDLLEIEFEYPDAFLPAPRISETRKRAIKLLSFALEPMREPVTVELEPALEPGSSPELLAIPARENPAVENEKIDDRDQDAGQPDRHGRRPSQT